MEPQVEGALRSLRDAVAASQVVARLKQARETVENREAARIMLRDLQAVQGEILERAERGEEVPQELAARYQQVASLAAYNPYLRELVEAEAELAAMLDQIQRELLEAAGVTPPQTRTEGGAAEPTDGGSPQAPQVEPVRSKLWVPGQGQP